MRPGSSTSTYQRSGRVARTIQAMRGHRTANAAHQHELKVRDDARTLMHAYRAAGARDVGERMLRDLRAALAPETPELTDALIQRACRLDTDEEHPQAQFLMDRTPANARSWRLRLEAEHAEHEQLIRALRAFEEASL